MSFSIKTTLLAVLCSFFCCLNAFPAGEPCLHAFVTERFEATCTENGCVIDKCEKCGFTDTLRVITLLGHNFDVNVVSKPTCVEGGVLFNVCKTCGFEQQVSTEPLGHNYKRIEHNAASCTQEGFDSFICTRCSQPYLETLSPLGHDFVEKVVEPTFSEAGCFKHVCSRCEDFFVDSVVPKLDINDFFALKINEVMPCNISTIINHDDYNFVGYIEFFNPAANALNLENCTLTHYKQNAGGEYEVKWVWHISSSLKVTGNSYTLIWMDGTGAPGHSPYKLDPDGGCLTLYAGNVKLDSFAYDKPDVHVAFGCSDGSVGLMEPTPGEANSRIYTSRCSKPVFSVNPGILETETTLELTSKTADADIYYTVNGTVPSVNGGIKYTGPITVSKNMNIRAVAFKDGLLTSKIVTGSYIFMDDAHAKCNGFSLPIVSVTIDSLFYNDDTYGMFVVGTNGVRGEKDCVSQKANYNRDWKRPLNFEYFVDGKQVVSQEVEAAVEGGCSRSEEIKSISLKTSKKTGKSKFDYNFFASKPGLHHQTLHLRNGGTAYNCIPFRDGLMQTFTHGMNIDYQAYQPVAYFLNGEYLGLMGLYERTNADYIKANYGYDDEEIDLITVSDQLGIQASKGSLEHYNEMVDFLNGNDPNDAGYYEGACKRMDMDEYIDYQIFQQFIVNTDWPGNNTKIWRAKENGIFRWILFDTDFGFDLCGYNWLNSYGRNMISWCQAKGSISWANELPWMVDIFKPLSKNEAFKKKFTTKYLINLADRFSEQNINHVFDSIIDLVSDEFCAAGGDDSKLYAMREFALKRPGYVYSHLNSYVEGDSVVGFTVNGDVEGAVFALNGERVNRFNGKYIAGYDFNLKAYAPAGYKFEGWKLSDSSSIQLLSDSGEQSALVQGEMLGVLKKSVDIYAHFSKCEEADTSMSDALTFSDEPVIRIFPNPVADILNIESSKPVELVAIYNLAGSMVMSEAGNILSVDVQQLPLGVYMLEVVSAGYPHRMKLIKR